MGYTSDLGSDTVELVDRITGFPMSRYGRLLDPLSTYDGVPVPNWQDKGTELANITNPYGFLEYAVGDGDNFTCFDFRLINAGPRGQFIVLHATWNSEDASCIDDVGYYVLPCNSIAERRAALVEARGMVSDAIDRIQAYGIRHSRKGWNQDKYYFLRDVYCTLFAERKYPYKQLRFGGVRIDNAIGHEVEQFDGVITSQHPKAGG